MNLKITGHHLDVTPAIREFTENKLQRVLKRLDNITEAHCIYSLERNNHQAEIAVRIPGKELFCEASDHNLYTAIDALSEKLDRLVSKHKSKQKESLQQGTKRVHAA
ncbi:ribosome hibernation-promoting factor, HPF/YfiA family [Brackiella oedipodis]|uniref:ribosome hibernation-promoting factor, HPF/YfiA family n=1 Tax=Brackiella oedipodis TaxID=124225 RepID=UPI00048FCE96|nr:ribosome-associated translation inhibitor RaiA [Brackiella oedipodis]